MKKALIIGITGQDGSWLTDLLLAKGYKVAGIVNQEAAADTHLIAHTLAEIKMYIADLADQASLTRVMEEVRPDEVYNLAAISFVPASIKNPVFTSDINAVGVARVLEAIRQTNPAIRFCQASSSEMFGLAPTNDKPLDENAPFHPRNPYAVAKVFAHHLIANYRHHHGLYACSAILFNHDGPRRTPNFLTRKVTRGVASIKLGLAEKILLGNLDSRRDWGDARDYVQAMWLMLQQDKADDYVIGSGRARSIREFLTAAFAVIGITDWQPYVGQDPRFMRRDDTGPLVANPAKAKQELGWQPRISFEQMVRDMVQADLEELSKTRAFKDLQLNGRLSSLEQRLAALEAGKG